MIDEQALFAEDLPYDQPSEVFRIGSAVSGSYGEPLQIFVQGDLTYDTTNSPHIRVVEQDFDGTNPREAMRIYLGGGFIRHGEVVFSIPTTIVGYAIIELVDVDAGTWTAGAKLRPL